jgi:hypothetical protein
MAYMDDIMAEWRAAKAREASDLAAAAAARANEQKSLGLNSQGTVITTPNQIVKAVNNNPVIVTTQTASSVTSAPTSSVSASTSAVVSEQDKRNAYAASFTGWDNDPTLRSYQQRAMDIYVSTGLWNTPEQLQLHSESEAARKAINVTYKGSDYGTLNKAAADALILPDNQPNVTSVSNSVTGAVKSLITGVTGATGAQTGGLVKAGLGVGALLLVFSMFKGRG